MNAVAALLVAGLAASAGLLPGTAQGAGRVPEQTMPDLTAPAPEGVWFTELHSFGDGRQEQWLARITPDGAVRRFRARLPWDPTLGTGVRGVDPSLMAIAVGSGGEVWYAGDSGLIGRLTPSGKGSRFPVTPGAPVPGGGVDSLAAAPAGGVWFTGTAMGHMGPDGVVTPVALRPGESAHTIATGPDGDPWFVHAVQRPGGWVEGLARIAASGAVAAFPPLTAPSYTSEIANLTAGPDGNLWFTQGRRIGRITASGQVTRFPARIAPDAEVESLAAGPDGNLWFTVVTGGMGETGPIGRMTPAGAVTFIDPGVEAWQITAGPDGNLWFAESNSERIGRMTLAGKVTEFPPAPRVTSLAGRGARGAVARLRCPPTAPFACGGTITLQDEDEYRAHRYGVARFALAPGATGTVRVPLWARGRRVLAARRTLPLVAVVRPRSARTGSLGGRIARGVILRRA